MLPIAKYKHKINTKRYDLIYDLICAMSVLGATFAKGCSRMARALTNCRKSNSIGDQSK